MDVDRTWGSTLVKNHDDNKTYILVKLSESFANAIQECSAPKIKFHGSRGAIKFQNGKSYDFSLERSDNPVECIRESKNKWETVGKMACCLHVKGKDDVYQRTRTKMEVAEKEKRKNCTKLLDSPEHDSNNTNSKQSRNTTATKSSTNHSLNHNNINNNNSTSNNHNHHLSSSVSTTNHLSSSKSSDTSVNIHKHKSSSSSSSYNNHLSSSAKLSPKNHSVNRGAPISTAASDIKSSLLSLSTGSASSSSASSASSSSAAPATSGSSSINNHSNLNKFPDITDSKQMIRYKAEFDKDFKEYQNLHGYLHGIEVRFKKLKETLQQTREGSPSWEAAKEEIFNEYERLKGDSNFHKARAKYQQLYNKLAHIKKKIFQYKHDHRDKCNSRKKRKR